MKSMFFAATFISSLLISGAQAAPIRFLNNLSGSWSGSGNAYVAKYGDVSATCRVAIAGSDTKVAMDGSCGVFLFRQALGLSLKNVGGNKYIGTYSGSRTGPARLEGTLRGNRLVMNITWGGLVNGDRNAQMVLERISENAFAQTVTDRVNGVTRNTSKFTFRRR
jgi:hypothetical protein